MESPNDKKPTVNRFTILIIFILMFVLVGGTILIGTTQQTRPIEPTQQTRPTSSQSYNLTPEQYEENTRRAREHAAEQPASPPQSLKTKETVQEDLLSTLRTVPGVISIRQDGATLWVGVSLNTLGNPPTERAQEVADYIAKIYKGSIGQGICVRVYYGDERQLARSCT